MIQFTGEEIEYLKQKSKENPSVVHALRAAAEPVYGQELLIQEKGDGNWGMYYFCPDCSVPLTFDRNMPHEHMCPVCGKCCTGEPFDGTWWYKANMQNQDAAKSMGLIYLLTGEASYGRKAAELLLAYAGFYPDYAVHGDIPYNGPGKANAQTLDEAIFLRTLAFAYDLVKECMTVEEQRLVESRLFQCGMEFLMEHRHPQVHNHEVIIGSAIAVLGILLDQKDAAEEAVFAPYGLVYQLEHGMQEDFIWFEGTFGYHYYALENFMEFEKFAVHTEYSQIAHPNYRSMFEVVLDYVHEDGKLPLMNDVYVGHGGLNSKYVYEFAYRHIPGDKMAQIMNLIYKNQERTHIDAFLYGVDIIESAPVRFLTFHSDKGSGYTVFRGKDERYLIFKHGKYGGEHDHYDRLGISYYSHGCPVIPDLGTTGYGAALHYDYYKNTGTHNTICINEENQPPACAWTTRYEEADGIVYAEAQADWRMEYQMPDSFTIVQWDAESYRNVSIERKIAWAEDFVVDYVEAAGAGGQSIDWTLHIPGERVNTDGEEEPVTSFSGKKPLKYLHDVVTRREQKAYIQYKMEDGLTLFMWAFCPDGQIYYAKGPDNPSVRDMEYVIGRSYGEKACYLNVFQSKKPGDHTDKIKDVAVTRTETCILVNVTTESGSKTIVVASNS